MARGARAAVVVHLYYEELWPEVAHYVRHIPAPLTIYVTLPRDSKAEPAVLKAFPKAMIVRVEDVGRDVLPFISLIPELQRYTTVCKIHTKRDALWRKVLLDGVAGSRDLAKRIVDAFEADSALGIVGPRRTFVPAYLATRGQTLSLLRGALGEIPLDFGFFAGTMFWIRPAFISHLPNYYPAASFVAHREPDGYPEHALERIFGLEMTKDGRRIGLVDESRKILIGAGNYAAVQMSADT